MPEPGRVFDDSAKEEIRARIDIADLVGRYVKLKQTGRNLKGLCPFHKEKTPSFIVTPDRGTFHCFGCDKGGDIYTFLQEIEGIEFREALEMLAEEANVKLPTAPSRTDAGPRTNVPSKRDMFRIHTLAMNFYYRQVKGNAQAVAFFKGRGLQAETVREFRLGYAPPGWSNLMDELQSKGVAPSAIVACGLALQKDEGRPYDRFRDRVIFTLFDPSGRAIGFAGRGLAADAQPKYLNSPETPIYRKSRTLYGIHKALPSIKESGEILVVEGYMDFLSLYETGIRNAVATSGTALTSDHAHMIRRYAPRVVLVFDGDSAGVQAAERGVLALAPVNLDVRVLILPDEHDPDTFVREKGADSFRELVRTARPAMTFLLDRAIEQRGADSPQQKSAVVSHVGPLLNATMDTVVHAELVKQVAERLSLAEQVVREQVSPQRTPTPSDDDSPPPGEHVSYAAHLEGHFIHVLIAHPELIAETRDYVRPETFTDRFTNELYCILLDVYQRDPALKTLLDALQDAEQKRAVASLMVLEEPSPNPHEELAHTVVELQKKFVRHRLREITLLLRKDPHNRELLKEQRSFSMKLRDLTMGQP